jgi:hypothetical protein
MFLPFLGWEAYYVVKAAVAYCAVKLLLVFYLVINPEWFIAKLFSPFVRTVARRLLILLIR